VKAENFDINIINHYFNLLKNLSKENKEKLISKLKNSLNSKENPPENSIEHLFGAFTSDESEEELISSIRKSRKFNRNVSTLE
jgi:hypothetical protein